jgi:hypothetical protein
MYFGVLPPRAWAVARQARTRRQGWQPLRPDCAGKSFNVHTLSPCSVLRRGRTACRAATEMKMSKRTPMDDSDRMMTRLGGDVAAAGAVPSLDRP